VVFFNGEMSWGKEPRVRETKIMRRIILIRHPKDGSE